jgi:hypothetical protein
MKYYCIALTALFASKASGEYSSLSLPSVVYN